jgi:nitrite reductase/ring-hydroxylating ferredoxin subunit
MNMSLSAVGRSESPEMCPYLGFDLRDGCHDDERVFCLGHGADFPRSNGESNHGKFGLRAVEAFERGGTVYVQSRTPERE